MPGDDPQSLERSEMLDDVLPTALAEPETLVEALRYLQRRIPEFVQLSAEEQRSMTRVAHLDRAFVDAGIHAAAAWNETKTIIGWTAEELREEADEARRWDEVEVEIRALLKGIAAANLKRKHRLGQAILTLYAVLGRNVNVPSRAFLRPYYEEMKRAYLRRRTRSRRSAEPDASKE